MAFFEHGHALLIGVADYQDPRLKLRVPITVADARGVERALLDEKVAAYPDGQVTLLPDAEATRAGVLSALESFAHAVSPDDTAFLFFCGHGLLGEDGLYYFTTHDTVLTAGQKVRKGTGVSAPEFLDLIRKVKARRLLFLINTCFSGHISATLGPADILGAPPSDSLGLGVLGTGEGRVLITASRPSQYSFYREDRPHTYFGQALIDGLSGIGVTDRGGYIGLFELYLHLHQHVKEATSGAQEPVLNIMRGVGPFPVALHSGLSTTALNPTAILQSPPSSAAVEVIDRTVVQAIGRGAQAFNIQAKGSVRIDQSRKVTFRRVAFAPACMILLLMGLAFLTWSYVDWYTHRRVSIEYYANITRRQRAPAGIGRLTREESQARARTYKIHTRGDQVIKLEVVNGYGELTTEHQLRSPLARTPDPLQENRECIYDYDRDENGKVIREVARDRLGEPVWSLQYTSSDTAQHTDRGGFVRSPTGSGATYIVFTWSPDGLEKELRFVDHNGDPCPNGDGVLRQKHTCDERGILVEVTNLDLRGQPALRPDGYVTRRETVDALGNTLAMEYLDSQGQPTLHRDGFAKITYKYDLAGNVVETAHYDCNGTLTLHKNGYARHIWTFDERGNDIEETFFDTDGRPAIQKDGWYRLRRVCDRRGYEIEAAVFDPDGRLALDKFGFSRIKAGYDERGNRNRESYYDQDGRPTAQKLGIGGLRSAFNERGQMTRVTYFDVDDHRTWSRDGYARTTWAYDLRGKRIEEAYFDVNERRTVNKDGYAKVRWVYDDRGNLARESYYGRDDEPTLHRLGFARIEVKSDANGNTLEEEYFGMQGHRALRVSGYATLKLTYNSLGRVTREEYLDTDGKPTFCKDGFSKVATEYNSQGFKVQDEYYDRDGKRTLHKDGYATIRWEHNAQGYITAEAYYGAGGLPVVCNDKYASGKLTVDSRGNITEQRYFGVYGEPVMHSDHYSVVKRSYDNRGNKIEERLYDTDGKTPIADKRGVSVYRTAYDARNHQSEVKYFNTRDEATTDVNGVARLTSEHDERGFATWVSYYGLDGHLALHQGDRIARSKATFDVRGNEVQQEWFGTRCERVIGRTGCAVLTRGFDERGNQIREAYFGLEEGKRIVDKATGACGWRATYDDRGNRISTTYEDREGKPGASLLGVLTVNATYDARGNLTREVYRGLEGEFVMNRAVNYAGKSLEYNARSEVVDVAYFNVREKPVTAQVIVTAVEPGSPAESTGLRSGDTLIRYDGRLVANKFQLWQWVRADGQNARKKLLIKRDGKEVPLSVELNWMGLTLMDIILPPVSRPGGNG